MTPRLPLSMTPLFMGILVSPEWILACRSLKNMHFYRLWQLFAENPRIFAQSVFSGGGNEIKSTPIYLFCTSGSQWFSLRYKTVTFECPRKNV